MKKLLNKWKKKEVNLWSEQLWLKNNLNLCKNIYLKPPQIIKRKLQNSRNQMQELGNHTDSFDEYPNFT